MQPRNKIIHLLFKPEAWCVTINTLSIMKNHSIAFLVFGESNSSRNALIEDKYRNLAIAFQGKGFDVQSVIYNDALAADLAIELRSYDSILVWVNPIEQAGDRKILDALLSELSAYGCLVSAHPDTILKMGTKEVLYQTRDMEFGGDIKLYRSFEDFKSQFPSSAAASPIRILKQYRGNGGNGVFKIDTRDKEHNRIGITHAIGSDGERILSKDNFFEEIKTYFTSNSVLIDQEWNPNIVNGMVRCYLTGEKVAGFGYQEVNALYPKSGMDSMSKLPSKRYYYSEDCGLFKDLKDIMENNWVRMILEIVSVEKEMLPVIWDADFFINKINTENTSEKYSLCEINASCVSPFPESAIPYIVEEVVRRIEYQKSIVIP